MTYDIKLLNSKSGINYADFNDITTDGPDIVLIDGHSKLQQQICKFILTDIGSLSLFPNYGTSISSLLNNRLDPAVIQDVRNQITYCLKYVKSMNEADGTLPNISSVQNINIQVINAREIQMNLTILLSDNSILQIIESAMAK